MLHWKMQIAIFMALSWLLLTPAFADDYCQIARPDSALAGSWQLAPDQITPIPLTEGENIFIVSCDLKQDAVFTFQRPGLFSYQWLQDGLIKAPLANGQIAYALERGAFQAQLTLQAEDIYIPRFKWQPQQNFLLNSQQHSLIMGMFYGLGFTLVLLSLLVGWRIKAPALKLYGAYILSLTAFLLLQEGLLFIVFGNGIARAHQFAYIVSIGLTVLSATWFFSNFLYIKQDFPHLNRMITLLAIAVCGSALLRAYFGQQLPLSLIGAAMGYGTLLIVFSIFIVSIIQAWRGTREAGLICIALSIVLLSLLFRIVLLNYSLFIQRYGFVIALAIESIILALALAQRVSRVTQEKDIAEQAANLDPLCSIANRRGLQARLTTLSEQDPEDQMLYAAFYIDADEFKAINDHYGHHVGDLALQQIAACLNRNMRQHDIYGRLGGDEFIAIANFKNLAEVYKKHIELKQALSAVTFSAGHTERTVSASVGCAIFETLPASLDVIISASDRSMYEEKNSRKLGEV